MSKLPASQYPPSPRPYLFTASNSWEREAVVHRVPAPASQSRGWKGGLELSTSGIVTGTGLETVLIFEVGILLKDISAQEVMKS